ncbi:MAG: extracellular solute-binding protein, partial [Chloroflexi bacterium]|nr:extracellular solute-binding protein [Chloroflexota bacterium]
MTQQRKTGLSRREMLKTIAGSAVALGALPAVSVLAQDPVTITYWHGWTEQWENYVQDIVDAFHEHQDAIRVEPLVVPYGDFLVRLTAAISAGNPPDIVTFFGSNEIPGLAALGGITPYTELGPPEEIAAIEEFLTPAALAGGVVDGTVYGTPSGFGVYDLAWNKNQFEESGLDPEVGPGTIEELDAMAEQLTVEDADGNLDRVGLLHLGSHASHHRAWFGNFGGQIYDAENDA